MKTAINLVNEPNIKVSANIVDNNGDNHSVDFTLRTMRDGSLIADMSIDGTPDFYGRRCVDRMPLTLNKSISGNFYFEDQYGNTDPNYKEYNTRYLLIYDTEFKLS